jgi:hypothetical protein
VLRQRIVREVARLFSRRLYLFYHGSFIKAKKENPNSDLAATKFFTTGSFEIENKSLKKGGKKNSDKSILPTTLFLQMGCSWLPVAKRS